MCHPEKSRRTPEAFITPSPKNHTQRYVCAGSLESGCRLQRVYHLRSNLEVTCNTGSVAAQVLWIQVPLTRPWREWRPQTAPQVTNNGISLIFIGFHWFSLDLLYIWYIYGIYIVIWEKNVIGHHFNMSGKSVSDVCSGGMAGIPGGWVERKPWKFAKSIYPGF